MASIFFFLVAFTGCSKAQEEKIEPKIAVTIPKQKIRSLPSAFNPLSDLEKKEEWAKEYFIGQKLAGSWDLYRAITAFKRAEILIPGYLKTRLNEIHYFIVLSYYLGEKYQEAIDAFDHSPLLEIDSNFPVYKDLLVILLDCFTHEKNFDKAATVLKLIQEHDNSLSHVMKVSYAMTNYDRKDLNSLQQTTAVGKDTSELLHGFDRLKKSETKAQVFNALLPGMGYLYLGQKQTAFTAFMLNALTTYAAYHFFSHGNIAAGVLFTSIETGWYFGGITGAKESAKLYNERIYEHGVSPIMQKHHLHPILNLSHAF
jgi:tetratricopeptide (TPR) repeat protein